MTRRAEREPEVRRRDPPLVTVLFEERRTPPRNSQASEHVAAGDARRWATLQQHFPGARIEPLFAGVSTSTLEALAARGQELTPRYRPARFASMFVVRLPQMEHWGPGAPQPGPRLASRLAALIGELLPAERVSVETVVPRLPLRDGTSVYDAKHLDSASKGGVDVEAVRSLPGGKGEGEALVDVERGWHVGHVEFSHLSGAPALVPLGAGVMSTQESYVQHGTRALSVAVARENSQWAMGVAPLTTDVSLASELRGPTEDDLVAEDGIMEAVVELTRPGRAPGGVILLELEKQAADTWDEVPEDVWGPCEMKHEVFEVIQLAVANHLIVVEAAGNGDDRTPKSYVLDLDALGTKLLHGDSGAILVGQAFWNGSGHTKIAFGCIGERIDCFATGDGVAAASTTWDSAAGKWKDDGGIGFTGTSAAAAIVAGCALVVQGLVRNRTLPAGVGGPAYLTPAGMRALLGDIDINTRLAPDEYGVTETKVIGVMPDLAAIAKVLGLLPDLYVRDALGDDGDPVTGRLYRSPDIIVLNAPLAAGTSPDDAFGEDSGTKDRDDLSDSPVEGQPAWIHVRVRNRGGQDVVGATVCVYYAPASTLAMPPWKKIGEALLDVPMGGSLVVSPAIHWTSVPDPGHYCFIATVEHVSDKVFTPSSFAPPGTVTPTELERFSAFADWIRRENNVAWRNFEVVAPTGASTMYASVTGAAGDADAGEGKGEPLTMELRVVASLPAGAELEVDVPHDLGALLSLPAPLFAKVKQGKHKVFRGALPAQGTSLLGLAPIPFTRRHAVGLRARLPPGTSGEASLVQLHKGLPVGRMTWRFVEPASA